MLDLAAQVELLKATNDDLRKRDRMATEWYIGSNIERGPISIIKTCIGYLVRASGLGGPYWNNDHKQWDGWNPPTYFIKFELAEAVAKALCEESI